MKKLILVAAILVSTFAMAQKGPEGRPERGPHGKHEKMMADLSADQIAQLHTKRMTLALDLTEKQQKEILTVNTELAQKHKARFEAMKAKKESKDFKKPTAEERYAKESARLDEQIALKNKMKSILNADQYAKWSEMKEHKKEQMKQHFKKRGQENHRRR